MHYTDRPALHVGIIMDGNGRWAKSHGLARVAGHARGARRVSEIVRVCPDLGITHLTLYAFSTENWQRPLTEIDGLMRLFEQYICGKMAALRSHDVRVRFVGMRHRVPEGLQKLMARLESHTSGCSRLNLTIAIDYGSRDEITRAVRNFAGQAAGGGLRPEAIDEARFGGALDTAELPDPDLIIRTSGEQRVSNFLLWQGIYAEYTFPPEPWPEFTSAHLRREVEAFGRRHRRFGLVDEPEPGPQLGGASG